MNGEPFSVVACLACGHAIWPPRPVCPRCGGVAFEARAAGSGTVEETTRHGDAALASVRSSAGPVVIARLGREVGTGTLVELSWDGAPGERRRVLATPRSGAPPISRSRERRGYPPPRDPTSTP